MVLSAKWKLTSFLLILLTLCNYPSLLTAKSKKSQKKVTCGLLRSSPSEKEDCYRDFKTFICPNVSQVGRILKKECRFPYVLNEKQDTSYMCAPNGDWIPKDRDCQLECGTPTPTNEYPWIVAIYNPDGKLVCPGVIISYYHVVTGAQCIPTDHHVYRPDKTKTFGKYIIIAGKHTSNLRRKTATQQTRRISYIAHKTWAIAKEGHIIFMEVNKPFEFFDDVRPACLDWQLFYEEWEYKDINEGIVVGWKQDKQNVVPCSSAVHYWKRNICWQNLHRDYKIDYLLEHDKSCAVYTDDESKCGKYFDMGIFFKPFEDRYYLRGISDLSEQGWKKYVIYTKISSYFEWLKVMMVKEKKHSRYFKTFGKQEYANVSSCILPDDVQYGKFSLAKSKTYPNGTWVPSNTVIFLTCNNYGKFKVSFRCTDNEWYPAIEKATCRPAGSCQSLNSSESEEVFCKLKDKAISCHDPPANTTAVIVCREFYVLFGQKPVYKCQNGKWDPPFRSCSLECGTKRVVDTGLPTEVTDAVWNEYPWIVGIYKDHIQVCAGTLISRRHIVSAAHCFENMTASDGRVHDYWFIAGKYFKDFNINEPGFQIRTEATIYIHEKYVGISTKYRSDIAVTRLDEEFVICLEVQPVCIDWENTYEDIDFTDSKTGVIAGWTFTNQIGYPSYVLRKLAVPFQPKEVCLHNLPSDFSYTYAAADKVCAEFTNNETNVCKDDGGAGLYFKSDGRRYFLRGIVSLTMKTTVGCDTNHYNLYTKLSNYLPWIANITRKKI